MVDTLGLSPRAPHGACEFESHLDYYFLKK